MLLGDFSLCFRFTDGLKRCESSPWSGPLLYSSPEILKSLPYVGPEVDIWGLGNLRKYL